MLEGTFQDEHGRYAAGSYLRDPPGTWHSPAADGCVTIAASGGSGRTTMPKSFANPARARQPTRDGASAARVLFDDGAERVSTEDWRLDASVAVVNRRGLKFHVLSSRLAVSGKHLVAQSWGLLPDGQNLTAEVEPGDARRCPKDSPLQHPDVFRMQGWRRKRNR